MDPPQADSRRSRERNRGAIFCFQQDEEPLAAAN
jgi:hypothetical protein